MNFLRRSVVAWGHSSGSGQLRRGVRTFDDMREVVPFLVALHVARKLDTRLQPCLKDIGFVQEQNELRRAKQLARAYSLPQVEGVKLLPVCQRRSRSLVELASTLTSLLTVRSSRRTSLKPAVEHRKIIAFTVHPAVSLRTSRVCHTAHHHRRMVPKRLLGEPEFVLSLSDDASTLHVLTSLAPCATNIVKYPLLAGLCR